MRAAWMMTVFMLLLATVARAGIYKTYDKNGNVVFTDVPSAEAKEVQTREITTMPALPRNVIDQKLKPAQTPAPGTPATEPASYRIVIKAPKQEETVQYASPPFAMDVALEPALWKEHHLQVLLDGTLLAEDNFHATIDPSRLERGQHRLQVRVVNKQKKELGSEMADFFIQQPSALKHKP